MNVPYPHTEIVLVDNASTDGSVSLVGEKLPSVRIVASASNLGWAGGNNLGLRFAGGSYVLFLNNDATLHPNALTRLLEVAEQDTRIGVLGCKIYFPGDTTIQHAGGILRASGDTMLMGCGQKDRGQFNVVRDVDWVSGAAIMLRRNVLAMIGGFETLFGLYYEEADICSRARRANFRVVYVPGAIVYHRMSATIDRTLTGSGKYYRYQRSRLAFVMKNFGRVALMKCLIYEMRNLASHIVVAIPGWRRRFWPRSDPTKLALLLRAYYWNLVNLPKILRLRWQRAP